MESERDNEKKTDEKETVRNNRRFVVCSRETISDY